VFDVGRKLYERISGFGQHLDRLGKVLGSAVTAYNQAVGSLETRVLVSARQLQELDIVDTGQDTPRLVEEAPRTLSAPELTAVTAATVTTPEIPAPEPRTATSGQQTLEASDDTPSEDTPPELVMTHINGAAR
jgi:DNA recombination protein RmuC